MIDVHVKTDFFFSKTGLMTIHPDTPSRRLIENISTARQQQWAMPKVNKVKMGVIESLRILPRAP